MGIVNFILVFGFVCAWTHILGLREMFDISFKFKYGSFVTLFLWLYVGWGFFNLYKFVVNHILN